MGGVLPARLGHCMTTLPSQDPGHQVRAIRDVYTIQSPPLPSLHPIPSPFRGLHSVFLVEIRRQRVEDLGG